MKKYLYSTLILGLLLSYNPTSAEVMGGRFYPISPQVQSPAVNIPPKSIDELAQNFNHKIKIIFSDIDGTIIPFNKTGPKGLVPESAKAAAEELRQAQIPLILATGRSSWEGRQIAKRMGNEKTYIIGQQGAEILNPDGELIYQDTIKNKDAKKMIKEIKAFNKSNNQNSKIFVYTGGKLYMDEKYALPYLIEEIIVLNSFSALEKNFTPVKIGICETNPNKLKLIQAHLKKKFPKYHIDISADCYCDISSATATKGNGIKKLAQILKINLKEAAVLGDAENDISMLKLITANKGVSITVGNAMDKVKNNAEFVTAPATEGGFAKAIDKILANNARIK